MDRRTFLVAVSLGAGGTGAIAQPRLPRIGLVIGGARAFGAFHQGLRELGYIPGQSIVVESRETKGLAEAYRPAIESVLKAGVDLLVVSSTHGVTAARALAGTVPVIAIDLETDPVASGVVASLSRPGGNITGFFLDVPEMSGKLVQLLKEVVPAVKRIAVLWDAAISRAQFEATENAARAGGTSTHSATVQKASDLAPVLTAAVRDGARALIVLSAPLTRLNQALIDELALRHRLPSVTLFSLIRDGNGLLSYGPDLDDMFRRSASYVDRILKGARVGDLPVERPSRFDLAVNLRAAKTLGLTIPPSLLLRADQVIE